MLNNTAIAHGKSVMFGYAPRAPCSTSITALILSLRLVERNFWKRRGHRHRRSSTLQLTLANLIGLTKAYCTRVGGGPSAMELFGCRPATGSAPAWKRIWRQFTGSAHAVAAGLALLLYATLA